jgi:glycosyltransferase involved in cell wall biosynthesis
MAEALSVVITCYREGRLLEEAVQSAKSQASAPDEIVVVNDASPDATTNGVCRRLEALGVRVVWLAKNVGPSRSRDAGFQAAAGDIFVPLDADDLLPPGAIGVIRDAFRRHPDAGFIHGAYLRRDDPRSERVVPSGPVTLRCLLRARPHSLSTNWTLIGTAPLRRALWRQIGGCDPNMGAEDLHDVDFWIRALTVPCAHYSVDDVIYVWRKYLGSNSGKVTPLAWARLARRHESVYREHGLAHRACELLLLADVWNGDMAAAKTHRHELRSYLKQGEGTLSTLALCVLPLAFTRGAVKAAFSRR